MESEAGSSRDKEISTTAHEADRRYGLATNPNPGSADSIIKSMAIIVLAKPVEGLMCWPIGAAAMASEAVLAIEFV